MQYLVKFRWNFNSNIVVFDKKSDAIAFASTIRNTFSSEKDFYCDVIEFDRYNSVY